MCKYMRDSAIALSLSMLTFTFANATTVTVQGNSGPWDVSVNASFGYGNGTQTAPTSVPIIGGALYDIAYVSGLWSTNTPANNVDAGGYPSVPNFINAPFLTAPGFYTPAHLQELIGTFATNSGLIVGTPFTIGNGLLSITAPLGSSLLLLGTNDTSYQDNTGAILVSVNAATPLPAALPLFAGGLGALGLLGWRRKHARCKIGQHEASKCQCS